MDTLPKKTTATEAKKTIGQQAVQAREGVRRRWWPIQHKDHSQEARWQAKDAQGFLPHSYGKFTVRTITPSQSEIL